MESEGLPSSAPTLEFWRGSGRARWLPSLLLAAVYFAGASGLQELAGAYRSELSGYPDEPGHFVTGVMVKDYLKTFPLQAPLAFAKEFYIRRPRIAIGHWPPVPYALEGFWFTVLGASRYSALALMAVISAAVAASIAQVVRRWYGTAAGIAAGAMFLGLGFVQQQTSEVMMDMLVTMFGLWATFFFARFLEKRRTADVALFAGCSLLAIFTKNNGLYLAFVPPFAILLSRQRAVLRSARLWLGALFVGVPSVAWIIWSHKYVAGTWVEKFGIEFFIRSLRLDLVFLYAIFGPAFLILIAAGVVARLRAAGRARSALPGTLLAAALGVYLFQSLAPAGIEPRFLLPAVAALIPMLFSGVMWIAQSLSARAGPLSIRAAALLAIAILVSPAGTFRIPHKPYRGFSEVAELIESRPDLRNGATIVSSASDGEGLLISEVTMRYPYRQGYILRASKILSQSDWLGRNYRSNFSSADEMSLYLDELRAGLIVVEEQQGAPVPTHQEVLLQVVQQHSDQWSPVGVFPQNRPSSLQGAKILVYQRIGGAYPADEQIHRDMDQVLRRALLGG
jgi:hypothetical protein